MKDRPKYNPETEEWLAGLEELLAAHEMQYIGRGCACEGLPLVYANFELGLTAKVFAVRRCYCLANGHETLLTEGRSAGDLAQVLRLVAER